MRLTADDARRFLVTADHAVLAVNDGVGPPLVVPVTIAAFDVDGTACLAFAVDHKPKSGARLRRLIEADWTRLWWARADGRAEVLGPDDRRGGAGPGRAVERLVGRRRGGADPVTVVRRAALAVTPCSGTTWRSCGKVGRVSRRRPRQPARPRTCHCP